MNTLSEHETDPDFREEIESEAGQSEAAEVEIEAESQEPEEGEWEARARRMGWRPKKEYNGDMTRWVDAKTFVERGETELPIVRERMRKMDKQYEQVLSKANTLEQKFEESQRRISEQTEVLRELRDRSRQAEQIGYERAMRDISERQRRAVSESDVAAFDAAEMEKRQIEASRPRTPAVFDEPAREPARQEPPTREEPKPSANPVIDAWVADNEWFQRNAVLRAFAIDLDQTYQHEYPGLSLSERLERVKTATMEKFPEKFGIRDPSANGSAIPPRRTSVQTPTAPNSAARTKGKTVRDLPADARAALARIKQQIPDYKDEEYLRLYFGNEA